MSDTNKQPSEEERRAAAAAWIDEEERKRREANRPWNRPDGEGERWRAAAAERARKQHAMRRKAKRQTAKREAARFPTLGRTHKKGMGLRRAILHYWPDDGGYYSIRAICDRIDEYEFRSVEIEIRKMSREGYFHRKPERCHKGLLMPRGRKPFRPVGFRYLYRLIGSRDPAKTEARSECTELMVTV